MFVIEKVFIEDNKLAKVLTAIAGLVVNMEIPKPVVNASVRGGKVKAASSASSIKELYAGKLAHLKGKEVAAAAMIKMVEDLGGSSKSVGKMNADLIVEKLLKRKSRGLYQVL